MKIHTASEEDIPLLRELAACIWRASYPGIISTEQIEYMLALMYSEETVRDELRRGVTWEVITEDGSPIGFQSYHLDEQGRCKLNKLYLLPEHQGRGHSRAMLAHIRTAARTLGASEVWLQVNKGNERAIAAYRKSGFTVAEEKTFDIGGGFVMDDYLMKISAA